MTVYIELVFFENFVIDYFLLLSGGRIAYVQAKHPVLASLLGAIYAVIMPLFYNTSFLQTFFVLALMCLVCFTPKSIKRLFYAFVAVSVSAGALFGITNLLFSSFQTGMFYEDNIFFVISLCSALLSVGTYRLLIPFMRRKSSEEYTALLSVCGKQVPAFIDTGNSLYYKDIPVVLINKELFSDTPMPVKPLIIPYSSVGNDGALLGFMAEEASVTYMNKQFQFKCVVALCDNKFQKNFDALLHPDLIKECV